MTNISGTNLAAGIVPFTTDDTYPTHYAMYGKGGHRTVQSIVNRNSIPTTLKEEGMTVFVLDDNTKYTWKKNPNNSNIVEWLSDSNVNAVGTNTQVIFNDSGVLAGDSGLLYNKTNKELTIYQSLELSNTNTKAGKYALLNLSSGNNNVAIGRSALSIGTAQNYNTAIGDGAGYTNSSILNTYIGYGSGRLHTGNHSTFIGSRCGDTETSGDYKLFIESNESRSTNKDYLIEGDFSQRWVKFNGAVRKRVVNITAPNTSLESGTASSGTSSSLEDTTKVFINANLLGKILVLTGGTGAGQVRRVLTAVGTVINLTAGDDWEIVPDNTTTYKIVNCTQVLFENLNSDYFITLGSEDYGVLLPGGTSTLNSANISTIISSNPNNKKLYIVGTGASREIQPYNKKYFETSKPNIKNTFSVYETDWLHDNIELSNLKPISTTTKDIQIDLNTEIYKLNVATATTVTLNVNSSYIPILTNNALTIELHINMTSASLMTFPNNVWWIGGAAPDFNAIGKYVLVFRTMDAGATWVANLAYTY